MRLWALGLVVSFEWAGIATAQVVSTTWESIIKVTVCSPPSIVSAKPFCLN